MCYTLAMQTIRSSDIGNYLFCRRSWWYRKQGFQSENQAELASGTELHRTHGRKVMASGINRILAYIILLLALILLVTYCTSQLLL
jgi:CRISPR/Cas system-associated exonuclease Cas4 (RecB family)